MYVYNAVTATLNYLKQLNRYVYIRGAAGIRGQI